MCNENNNEQIKQYPHLYKKDQEIKEELISQSPELEDIAILNNYK